MTLDTPAVVMARLQDIDLDLANRQNDLEQAALAWYRAKRDREHARARAFLTAQGTVAERNAQADVSISEQGRDEEARWEALRAVVRVLETRASIGQSLIRAMGRA